MNILKKIERGDYTPSTAYPLPPTVTCTCGAVQTATNKYCTDCGSSLEKLTSKLLEKWEEDYKRYREEGHRLTLNFKRDALKYVGLTGHTMAEEVFEVACKYNSGGLARKAVVAFLEDIVDIIYANRAENKIFLHGTETSLTEREARKLNGITLTPWLSVRQAISALESLKAPVNKENITKMRGRKFYLEFDDSISQKKRNKILKSIL